MLARRPGIGVRLSLSLLALAIIAGVVALVHPVSLRWRTTPNQSDFVRLDGWHLVFCRQWMVPPVMPESYECNTTDYGHFCLVWPLSKSGKYGLHLSQSLMFPVGRGFRWFSGQVGGMTVFSVDRTPIGFIDCFASALEIPIWSLILLFGIWPTIKLVAALRARMRHGKGHCPVCGYDLRATPERCPECGALAEKATA